MTPQPTYSILTFPSKEIPEAYKGLLFSKWLRSQRNGNYYYKAADSAAYYSAYHHYIENLLAKPDSKIRLAVLTDDHDVVLGFSVHRGAVMDYIYVHKDMRNNGIGTALIPTGTETFSHLTRTGDTIWKKKYKTWVFNPFA